MCISLRHIIADMTLPNIVYLKSKKELVDSDDADICKLQIYKDYIVLPYVEQTTIYDAFLDDFHLLKEKEELHKSQKFDIEFRKYIDCNKKFDHELSRYYYTFETNFLKPMAIEWCEKNKVSYHDDL